jgi:peptidoglycan/xylan/chitin deacetylase (PgdA/CDA1 family)
VFGVAMALARHPEIVAAIKAADYDVVSHGWRWIHYQHMDIAEEREHLQRRCTSDRPVRQTAHRLVYRARQPQHPPAGGGARRL